MRESMTLMIFPSKQLDTFQMHIDYYNNCEWVLGSHCVPGAVGWAFHVSHQPLQQPCVLGAILILIWQIRKQTLRKEE